MTLREEKRFQIIYLGNPYEFVVKDNTTNQTYGTFEGDVKSMSDLLNKLYEEVGKLLDRIEEQEEHIQLLTQTIERMTEKMNEIYRLSASERSV